MKKILNYISNGQGLGIKYLLLLSAIVSIFSAVVFKISGDDTLVPNAQKVADEFLPIRIENGVIVEPENTVKSYNIVMGEDSKGVEQSFNVVLDTTTDTIDTAGLPQGMYISRKAVYVVEKGTVRTTNLEDSTYLEKKDYTDTLQTAVTIGCILLAIIGFIVLFVYYLLLTLFYANCSYIVSSIFKKNFEFDLRMRLSALAFIATYVIFVILEFFNFSSLIVFFVAVLALQTLVIKEIPEQEKKNIK